jgi:integrase
MAIRIRGGRFMLDVRHMLDGRVQRFRLAVPENKQTRRGAEAYERQVLADLRAGIDPRRDEEEDTEEPKRDPVPTLATFAQTFLDTYASTNNRPRTVREKRATLNRALLPALGGKRLDQIGPREIEAYKAERAKPREDGTRLANKTINEEVGLLGTILRLAHEWEIIAKVPRIRRLKLPPSDFDFLDFGEADRLIAAGRAELDPWGCMLVVAIRTGLRAGELRALKWEHVDTVAGRLVVRLAADDRGGIHRPRTVARGRSRCATKRSRACERTSTCVVRSCSATRTGRC